MVSTRPPTSKSSSPFNIPLVTAPNAPITGDIIVTFMFYIYIYIYIYIYFLIPKQGLDTYFSFHFLSVLFYGQPVQQSW